MAGFGSLAPGVDWRDAEAQANLAALQQQQTEEAAAKRTWWDTATDVAGAPARLAAGLAADPAAPAGAAPFSMISPQNTTIGRAAGNVVWNLGKGLADAVGSGATLPGDVAQGKISMTDPEGRSSPELIHRAFDTASLAGGGTAFGQLARPAATEAPVAARVVALAQDSQASGAPLAALERGKELAVERRNKGWATGKSAPGHDFKRPDPEAGSFDRLHADATARYKAQAESPNSPLLSDADKEFIRNGWFYEDASKAGAPVAALEHLPSAQYTKLLDEIQAPAIAKTKLVDEQGLPIKGPAYNKEARAVLADIEKGPKGAGPMDITLQQGLPDVPQVDLPRYAPPRGMSPRLAEAIETPEVRAGLRQSMEEGRGVANWYHTDPVRVAFVNELGPARGQTEFKRFMDTVAATSPRSDVPTNIRNASYYFQRGAPENLPAVNPYPYGHVAQKLHRGNFETISREAGWDPLQNPKPASFAENLSGNLEPVTVDTHAFRNIGMRTGDPRFLETQIQQKLPPGVERGPNSLVARFGEVDEGKGVVRYRPQQLVKAGKLTMEEAQQIPTFWAAQPKPNEYAAAEGFFKDVGREAGLRPADAQAAAWAGGGELTGLGTVGTHTFPELMNERVLFTARMRGESPQKTLSDFVRGKAMLLEDSAATGAPIAALEHSSPAAPYHALLDQPPAPAYKPAHATETAAARETHPSAGAPRRDDAGGAGGGDGGVQQAQAEAARRAGAHQPLEGLPSKALKIGDEYFVPGPIAQVRDVAADYMANKPVPSYHTQPTKYHPLNEDHSRAVAKAFDEMKHDPDNPAVKASYKAMVDETKAQYQAIEKTGLKIEPIEPGMPDPYAKNPRLAAKDVADNNHLWYFPTDAGFGSNPAAGIDMAKHPMMQPTGIKLGGRELLANDLFRIVHDYFGHLKEGYGFRAAGEDNAWRSHASMYSDLARPAMTTETRGQNSLVNYSATPLYKAIGEARARELYGNEGRQAGAATGSSQRGGISHGEGVSGVQSLARDDGSLLQSKDRILGELRGAGDHGRPSVADPAGLSGRHGAAADRETSGGPLSKQRRSLSAGERALGDASSAASKSAPQRGSDIRGQELRDVGVGREDRNLQTHAVGSAEQARLDRGAGAEASQVEPRWKTITVGEHNRTASGADTIYADQKVGLMPEWTMRDRGSPEPIIAYHGSPHSFERFDTSKIGTGEGNQAYGHGLYFSAKDAVSEWYRHQLTGRRDPLLKKYGLDSQDGTDVGMRVFNAGGDAKSVAKEMREYAGSLRAEGRDDMATKNMIKRAEGKAEYLDDAARQKGHMYQVAIDAPVEKFLDYDAPYSRQPDAVKKVFKETADRLGGDPKMESMLKILSSRAGGQAKVTEMLKEAGVPGTRYLDQASRSGGKGTANYVTFDAPRLLRKYALPATAGFGSLASGRERE